MKTHNVERTNKVDITPEEQSEKTENCWEFMERNTVERAQETEMDNKKRIKRCGLVRLDYIQV